MSDFFRYSDWLSGYQHLKLEWLKICEACCVKGRHRTNISKFLYTLSFVVIPGMFWRDLTKIGQIYIPYKFTQSGCNPLKIKCKIFAHKGSNNLRHARRLSRLLKPQTNGVNDDGSRFPGKSNPLRTRFLSLLLFFFFFISIAQ